MMRVVLLTLIVLVFGGLSAPLGTPNYMLGVQQICEGWFCETVHLDIVQIGLRTGTAQSLLTIIPSGKYDDLAEPWVRSVYDSTAQMYYVIVATPNQQAFLYALNPNKPGFLAFKFAVPYSQNGLSITSLTQLSSSQLLAIYGPNYCLIDLQKKAYKFTGSQIYNPQTFATTTMVSVWTTGSTLNVVAVPSDRQNPIGCYYAFTSTNFGLGKTSPCIPNEGNLGGFDPYYFAPYNSTSLFTIYGNVMSYEMGTFDPVQGQITNMWVTFLAWIDAIGYTITDFTTVLYDPVTGYTTAFAVDNIGNGNEHLVTWTMLPPSYNIAIVSDVPSSLDYVWGTAYLSE